MKTIIRNSVYALGRFKTANVLNVAGLAIAFVAFMLLMIQVEYDRTFDSCHPDSERIFRLDLCRNDGSQAIISRPFARAFIASSPHIKSGFIMNGWFAYNVFFYIERNGEQIGYKEEFTNVTPEMLNVFSFDWIEGTDEALDNPNSVIIPESIARKLFGNKSAINEQLIYSHPQTIKGVYKDFPRNSSLRNIIYTSMHPKENYDEWWNWNYMCFVRLDDAADKETILDNFKKNFDVTKAFGPDVDWDKDGFSLRMTSLPEVHFLQNVDFDTMPKANRQTLFVLLSIALAIIIIAGINFANFNTACAPMRIKSINIQKILGSSDRILQISFLVEAVGICLFAYLISLVLLVVVQQTPIGSLIDADISFGTQYSIIAGTAIIAVAVGLLAGFYPSCYITSFPPALVMKGNFGLSPTGRRIRSMLVVFQFVACFVLIIISLFMFLQNSYMQKAPLGYDKSELITITLNGNININRNAFTNQLKSHSGIEAVTYSQFLLSSEDQYMGWEREYKGKNINFQCLPVSSSFLKVLGIDVIEGRSFLPEDDLKENGCFIFNEKAKAQYNLNLNERIEENEIIGFIPDVKFASFRQEVSPMAFYLWGKYQWGQENKYYDIAYVKSKKGSDLRVIIDHVHESLAKFDKDYPFDVCLYDEILQRTYDKELRIGSLIALFSIVAIFISIVGVLGLVMFDCESKRKEIAVRKVLGSTNGEVLYMLNRNYFGILLTSFALAAPLAWCIIHYWLENFAYRTPMHWWVLLVAFVPISAITIITVAIQSRHAANENPVNSIQ